MDIKSRWNDEVIYKSDKTMLRDALIEAVAKHADLSGADLRGAYLRDADLRGAYLRDAYLRDADLSGADLKNTILDATGQPLPIDDKTLTDAGFELDGDFVIGWRTKRSQHIGSNVYDPGKEYEAPFFSICHETPCHPGIYLAGEAWLSKEYGDNAELVRVKCYRHEIVHAGDKFRARRIIVLK